MSFSLYGNNKNNITLIVGAIQYTSANNQIKYIKQYQSENPEFGYNKCSGGFTNSQPNAETRLKLVKNNAKGPLFKRKQNFLIKSFKIHGNKYDYSKINFVNVETKVEIKCNNCGLYFFQTPEAHSGKQEQGCPYCRYERLSKTTQSKITEFEKRLVSKFGDKFGDKFVINKGSFFGVTNDVELTCKICNYKFTKRGSQILKQKFGCRKCSFTNGTRYRRPIYKLNPVTYEIIEKFESLSSACQQMGCSWIQDCIRRNICGAGYRWQYVDQMIDFRCNK